MALDIFSDALETLEEQQPDKAKTSTFDQASATIDRLDAGQQGALRGSLRQVEASNPDTAAEARKLSLRYGQPPGIIERNIDDWRKQAAGDRPIGQMVEHSPATAAWASDPNNAAIAKDDLEQLGTLEWILAAPQRQFAQTVNQARYSELRFKGMFSSLTREELDQMDAYKFHSEQGGRLGTGDSWFRKGITGFASLLANQVPAAKYGTVGAVGGLAIGAAGAAVMGPEILAGGLATAAIGGRAGLLYGVLKSTFQGEASGALDEFEGFRDEHGQALDPNVAKAAALAVGAINAPIEAWGLDKLLEGIPGLKALSGDAVRGVVKEALRKPTIRAALAQAVGSYGSTLSQEVGQEVAQRAVTIMAGEFAKAADQQAGRSNIPAKGAEMFGDLASETIEATQSFALGLAPGPGMSLALNIRRAQSAQQGAQMFQALGEGIANSKTMQRLPEAMQTFVEKATKDGPISTVYAPADTWRDYWQAQGVDPAQMAAEVTGRPNAFEEAVNTGGDLAIPTSRYASTLAATEHNTFLSQELRLGPDEMNARESAAFAEQLKAESQNDAAKPEASPAEQKILESLIASGASEDQAQEYAKLYRMVSTLSERSGLGQNEILDPQQLEVLRPAIEALKELERPAAAETEEAAHTSSVQQDEEIPGLAALEATLGDATLETPSAEEGTQTNASGESAASLEATNRLAGMRERGEQFGVYDRAGQFVPKIGPEAVDYQPQTGETFGVMGPNGFQTLTANGGRVPMQVREGFEAALGARRRQRLIDNNALAVDTEEANGNAGAETGDGIRDGARELAPPDSERDVEGAGDGARVERERLPTPGAGFEEWQRHDKSEAESRLSEGVARELQRIQEELEEFPQQQRATWTWLENEVGVKGNVAGGHANKTAAAPSAQVYADIKLFAPTSILKSGPNKGTLANEQTGTTRDILAAIKATLEKRDITTALAEGAVRVAELRNAGVYKDISRPMLPPSWGRVASEKFTDTLSREIDRELADVNVLDPDSFEAEVLDPEGEVDTSFNVDEFSQSLFEPPLTDEEKLADQEHVASTQITGASRPGFVDRAMATYDARVQALRDPIKEFNQGLFDDLESDGVDDVLDTGEVQPRLPGAGEVRDQNIQTPEFEAPFSLTSEVAKPGKGKNQRTLFQSARSAFEQWFGASKIVNPDGSPMVVYHGTPATFEAFDGRRPIYLTTNKDEAINWGDSRAPKSGPGEIVKDEGEGINALALFARIENPLHVDDFEAIQNWTLEDVEAMEAQGYDGGVFEDAEETIIVAFRPSQVKSVDNVGSFNRSDDRMLFQSAPLTQEGLNEFARSVLERAGSDLTALNLWLTRAGDIELGALAVRRGAARAGLGTRVMTELTRFADLNGVRMVLSIAEKGYQPPGSERTSSQARLLKFYQRFGFVKNTGRRLDLSVSADMYREPTASPAGARAETLQQPTATPAFKAWFGASQVVDEDGNPLRVYHGTMRLDRFGETIKKSRATSGPMPFFTTDPEIASKYAIGKQDTSLADEDQQYESWFRIKFPSDRKAINIDRAWYRLDQATREKVLALAPRVQQDDEGNIVLGDESETRGNGGYYLAEHRGNALAALVDAWLNSGSLFNQERDFEKVLDLVGIPSRDVEYHDPHKQASGILPVYLSIQNPLDTSEISPDTMAALEQAAAAKRTRRSLPRNADMWDKTNRDAKEWIATLRDDLEKGVNSHAWSSIPDWVTDTLKALGYDGVKDTGGKMGGEEHAVWIPFRPGQVKSAIGNRGTFDPESANILKQDRRGAIRFGPGKQISISLFAKADASTFIHETGHLFLEVFADVADKVMALDPETLTDSQKRLLADYGGMLDYLGVESRDQVDTAQHEKWAEAFEKYVMTGQAPSLELQGAFSRFRAWMLAVYRSLTNLRVELSPAITGIMDRMLATDAEIAAAEAQRGVLPMFTTAADAGMTEEQFAPYRQQIAQASRTAREQLETKLLAEVQREQTAAWRAQRADILETVATEIHQQPIYQALAAMQKGTLPNGDNLVEGLESKPLKLSRAILVERFGEDRLKRLPKPYVYSREGGLDPDLVGRMFGYSSGDELLSALEAAPPMREAIETETNRRMIESQGSILMDGTVHEKAMAAVANEDRDAIIRAEMRMLGTLRRKAQPFVQAVQRSAAAEAAQAERERDYERRWFEAEAKLRIAIAQGYKQVEIDRLKQNLMDLRRAARGGAALINRSIPSEVTVNEAAKTRVSAMRVGDIRPFEFWHTGRRAAAKALENAARQDFDGAIQAKQQELINLAMFREASRVKEDIEARVKYARDLGKSTVRQMLGKAGDTYLDQVDGFLDRYEFTTVPQKVLDRRASLKNFVQGLKAQDIPVDIPERLLDDTRRVNWKDLTVEELIGVTDTLKHLLHLARFKNRLLKAAERRDFDTMKSDVLESIRNSGPAKILPLEFLPKDRKARVFDEWMASHTKLSEFIQRLDGYVDGGALWSALMLPTNDAATEQAVMHEAAGKAFRDIERKHYRPEELARFHDLKFIPAINASLSKEARLAVALNWGTEGNRQRLMETTRGWNTAQVMAILETLDARDLAYVQDTQDQINSYWDQIAAKQERVYGLAPEKVEASEWIHPAHGPQRGGYYPIAYEGRLSIRQGNIIDADTQNLEKHANYAAASTKRGFTETRQARVNAPLRLELAVAKQHIEAVIHDLTHHELMIDVGRILGDREIQDAIQSRIGDLGYKQMRGAYLDIALGTRHATTVVDRGINYVRNGTTIAGLAWNFWTTIQQFGGLANGSARVGPQWVARGMMRMFRDASALESSARWVKEKSKMMALRGTTRERDIADLRSTISRSGSWFDIALRRTFNDAISQEDVTTSYLWMIEKAQQMVDTPVWIGAYEKARAGGEGEARAIALADQVVLDSQSGGQIKDLAQVQRGNAAFKLFTTFYSYGNLVFNQTAREVGKVRRGGSIGQFLGNLSLIYIAPAFMSATLRAAVGKSDDDDPFLLAVGREMLSTALNTIVLLRELGGTAIGALDKQFGAGTGGARGYQGPAGLRLFSSIGNLITQAQQGEADRAFVRAAEDVAGILFQLPLSQVQRSVDGFVALEEGRSSNPGVLLVGAPPKKKGQ